MSPLYNSQALSNSPLEMVPVGSPAGAVLFNAETPGNGQASIAKAIQSKTVSGGQQSLSFQFECPLGLGGGVFQIQACDFMDVAGANFNSEGFGGANPGQVVLANMNASGVGRVELTINARFVRILCVTAPGNPVTVRVHQE